MGNATTEAEGDVRNSRRLLRNKTKMRTFIFARQTLFFAVVLWFFGFPPVHPYLTWIEDQGGYSDEREASPEAPVNDHVAAHRSLEKTQQDSSARRLKDGSISFLATTNTDLIPTKIENLRRRKVNSVDSMLRSTSAFKALYAPGTVATKDETFVVMPTVEIIRGGSEGFRELKSGKSKVLAAHHGLISAVVDAYNNHLNLVLRPDDIWIAIMTQFASYVNGSNRTEILRKRFVNHDGQAKLEVQAPGDIYTADFGAMTSSMLREMQSYIVNSTLSEWFLPGFTTSTPNDNVCAVACAMCTTQAFFAFGFRLGCGIPEVILEGTVGDWRMLRAKIEKLKEFDAGDGELLNWVSFLEVIGENLAKSADSGSAENLEFWDTIAHYIGGASATDYLSGWITTFSYFSNDGLITPTSLESEDLAMSIDVMRNTKPKDAARFDVYEQEYRKWPIIDSENLASSVVSCPVSINDNGTPYDARLFVGQMALNYRRAPKKMKARAAALDGSRRKKLRIIQPRNDWALAIEAPASERK